MNKTEELPIFRKTYALTVEFHRAVRNMPKDYRYTLGAEIVGLSWKCLDCVHSAVYAAKIEKAPALRELSRQFNRLCLRVRMLQELKIISTGQFADWQEKFLYEIGRQIGSWAKSLDAEAAGNEDEPTITF